MRDRAARQELGPLVLVEVEALGRDWFVGRPAQAARCVESGDAESLVLAVPTPLFAKIIGERFQDLIERATERRITFTVRAWASQAWDRKRKAG